MTLSSCVIVLYLAPECKACYVSILYSVKNRTWDTPATFVCFYYSVTLQNNSVGRRDRISIPFHWIRTIFTNGSYARILVHINAITFCDAINSWYNWNKRKKVKLIILKLAVKSLIYFLILFYQHDNISLHVISTNQPLAKRISYI